MSKKINKKPITRDEFLFWFKPIYDCLRYDVPKNENNFISRVTIDDVRPIDYNDDYIALEILCDYGPFAVDSNFDGFSLKDMTIETVKCTYNYFFSKKDFSLINSNADIEEVYGAINNVSGSQFELEDLDEVAMGEAIKKLCENLGAKLKIDVHSVMFDCGYPDFIDNSVSGEKGTSHDFCPDEPAEIDIEYDRYDLLYLAENNLEKCIYSLSVKPCKNNEYDLIFECYTS